MGGECPPREARILTGALTHEGDVRWLGFSFGLMVGCIGIWSGVVARVELKTRFRGKLLACKNWF